MAFIALLLYIICIYLRPAEWIPFFYGMQLLDILSILAFIFWVLNKARTKQPLLVKAPQNILMLGFFVSLLLSHIVHTYFGGMMLAFTDFSKTLIMFLLFVNIIDSERKFKITVYLLIFLTFLLALQGISQFRNGYGWAGQPLRMDRESGIGRITWISIFNDPNDLGLALVIAAAILIAVFFGRSNPLIKFFIIPILGYILYALYLTNSRGAWLALMVTGFFYFVKKSRRFLLGAIIGIAFIFLVFAFGPSRLSLLTLEEESAFNRVDAWYYGIGLTKSSPIFGVGYRMFSEDYPLTAHNTFVLALSEAGILGLFFWMGLLYSSFKGLSLVQKNNERLKNYAYGLQASLVGFSATAFFLSRLYITIPYLLFALSAAIFNVTKQKFPGLKNSFNFRDIRNTGFASIGIIGLVYVIIKIAL